MPSNIERRLAMKTAVKRFLVMLCIALQVLLLCSCEKETSVGKLYPYAKLSGTLGRLMEFDSDDDFSLGSYDVNKDNRPDFYQATEDGDVYLFMNNGDGTFENMGVVMQITPPPKSIVGSFSIAVEDFNFDGNPDIAVQHYDGWIDVYINVENDTDGMISNSGIGSEQGNDDKQAVPVTQAPAVDDAPEIQTLKEEGE